MADVNIGAQRIFSPIDNKLSLVESSTAVREALRSVFNQTPIRSGQSTGNVRFTGNYVGLNDAEYRINILSSLGGTDPIVTTPEYNGVGNPNMSSVSVNTGTAAGTVRFTLQDEGTRTLKASLNFFGIEIIPRAEGALGNGITITKAEAVSYTETATGQSTKQEMKAGQSRFIGQDFNFGGEELDASGRIQPGYKRLKFGDNPHISIQYRTFENGKYVYYFSEPIPRDIPVDTPIYEITGTYDVTITGSSTEVFNDIITLYDLLKILRSDGSDNVVISESSVVVDDRKPGGMNIEELPIQSDPVILSVEFDGNEEYLTSIENLVAQASALSEKIEIICTNNDIVGREIWSVDGTGSGVQADATTGISYTSSIVNFLIPNKTPESVAINTQPAFIESIAYVDQENRSILPGFELDLSRTLVGSEGFDGSITLEWSEAPAKGCEEESASIVGSLLADCLGIESIPIGLGGVVALHSDLTDRIKLVTAWVKTGLDNNIKLPIASGSTTQSSDGKADLVDIEIIKAAGRTFVNCIKNIVENTADASGDRTTGLARWDLNWAAFKTFFTYQYDNFDIEANSLNVITGGGGDTAFQVGQVYMGSDADTSGSGAYRFVVTTAGNWDNTGTWSFDIVVGNTSTAPNGGAVLTCLGHVDDLARAETDLSVDTIQDYVNGCCNDAIAQANLNPFDFAGTEGTLCWHNPEQSNRWKIVGTDLLPASLNRVYHAVRYDIDENGQLVIVPTNQFAFALGVTCSSSLQIGDRVVINFGDGSVQKVYLVGDKITLDVLGAQTFSTSGGINGNDQQIWTARKDAIRLSDYTVDLNSPADYNTSGIHAIISPGDEEPTIGSYFEFVIAGGTFEYQVDGGLATGPIDIEPGAIALSNGLSVEFIGSIGQPFDTGDVFIADVLQPNSPDRALNFNSFQSWNWDSFASSTVYTSVSDFDCDSVVLVHSIPEGTNVAVELLDSSNSLLSGFTIDWNPYVMLSTFTSVTGVRKVKITMSSSITGSVMTIWAGVGRQFSWDADVMTRIPETNQDGSGYSGEMSWDPDNGDSFGIKQEDINKAIELFQYHKPNDTPLIVLPHVDHVEEAFLCTIAGDSLQVNDQFQYSQNLVENRWMGLTLNLEPVLL